MDLKAIHKPGYGVYIVTSKKDKRINGQIANTVFQVSSESPTVAVSTNKNNLTHDFIEESRAFNVSILRQYDASRSQPTTKPPRPSSSF